ncbi:MAG: hypothetical protein IT242_07660 [Bacteroidia bacterium]|nr:hypothetical protein [Bacteroidia bacterium]
MEIIHSRQRSDNSHQKMQVLYGDKSREDVLQGNERDMLNQMHNVLSVIHGGEFRPRKNHHVIA